nr:putative ribonuclease H-like domain-containing protein [Tanacetum cinerariifolium]
MSRDVLTIGSTIRIPLLYRGEYYQLVERFMNYLEEQTDEEAMINSIKNGDQPLPRVTQVSIAGTTSTEQPPLKDKSMCNNTSKDLCDALARHMLVSEYGEQDRKAAVLYEYETFKATEGELLLDTYIRFLQVINDLKKCDGVDFLTGDRSSNLYTIALNEVASNSSTCLLPKASFSQSWLWHQRLSHLNFATINNIVKNNLVQGLPKMKFGKDNLCFACKQGKIHQKHHKSKTAFASNKPLYLLHMDLCGPMRVQSINGKRYVLVVVDDYSRYTWVFFLYLKDETSEVIISFIKKTQVNLQLQVQRVRTDNGTEFKNKALAKFFDEVGITQQFSVARTPQKMLSWKGGIEPYSKLQELCLHLQTYHHFFGMKPSQQLVSHKIVRLSTNVLIKLLMSSLTRENQTSTSFVCSNADVIFSMIMRILENLRLKEILECLLVIQKSLLLLECTTNELVRYTRAFLKVDEASKNDLDDLFQDFFDEY